MSNTTIDKGISPDQEKATQEQEFAESTLTTVEMNDTPSAPPANNVLTVDTEMNNVPPVNTEMAHTDTTTDTDTTQLPEKVRILKEAFPDTDVDIIEAILQATQDNVENAFETLLGMSDPNYSQPQEQTPPPMPPRPTQREPSVEEQLRLDEEFAKKLAMDDELRAGRRRSSQQQQQQQRYNDQDSDDDDPFVKFQEELPIIKEKMKEAGNAAKKKVMDLYNQFRANTQKNTSQNQYDHMPTTNAQYRGLPSDDGDDLLTGDNTALHLSDYDVYAKTNGKRSSEYTRDNDTIYVNPPLTTPLSKVQTSTSDAQLKADEDFARRLAEEDQLEARRSRQTSTEDRVPPQMPPRKSVNPTVVIAPRSPLEFANDSDYEEVGLTASNTDKNNNTTTTQSDSVPYVIGDDDDSDSDLDLKDLVDEEEEEDQKSLSDAVEKKDTTKEVSSNSSENVKPSEHEKPNTP